MSPELTILGSNSAVPAFGRFMTAQVLCIKERYFLIDCGEGTQMRMGQFKIRSQRIQHIFISHLHGDHIFGLIGLLMSYGLNHRTEALTIHCPPGLDIVIDAQLKLTKSTLSYPLYFNITDPSISQRILDDADLSVDTIPLKHRIPTHGFLFREKNSLRKILREKIEAYKIHFTDIPDIKKGNDWLNAEGKLIPNSELTLDPPKPRAYAFCSDTLYTETILPYIEGVDLLYHEATFMQDMWQQAEITMHTTALQAATIAQKAAVNKLLIGHFSSRYADLQPLLEEARTVFPETYLAIDGERHYL